MKKLTAEDFAPKNWPRLLWRLFTSWGLATVVLILMTIVTLIGTLDQGPMGLYAAKKKYFHSFFFTYNLGGFPLPLPGGLLLMTVLTTNLVLGAIVKVRKRASGIGMLISHLGMIYLLVAGFVTWAFTNEGYMALFPGNQTNRVESYRYWQLEILPVDEENKATKALTIPMTKLRPIGDGNERVFRSEELPFDVVVEKFAVNGAVVAADVEPTEEQAEWVGEPIGDFKLVALRKRWKDEKRINIPGLYATFAPKDGGESEEAIIAGESAAFRVGEKPMPYVFEMDGEKFAAQLVKKSWLVPFTVKLDKFIFERHPGTQKPKNFESRVTRIEDGTENKVAIRMNEPMRHEGLVFFQESFGSDPQAPDKGMYSQFAVNDNPADQWPLYALIVTGIGLLLHFVIKLGTHLNRALSKRNSDPTPTEA